MTTDFTKPEEQDSLLQLVMDSPDPYKAACLIMGTMSAVIVAKTSYEQAAMLLAEMARKVLENRP